MPISQQEPINETVTLYSLPTPLPENQVSWGNSSVSIVFAMQARGPMFKLHNLCEREKKTNMMENSCNSRLGRQR